MALLNTLPISTLRLFFAFDSWFDFGYILGRLEFLDEWDTFSKIINTGNSLGIRKVAGSIERTRIDMFFGNIPSETIGSDVKIVNVHNEIIGNNRIFGSSSLDSLASKFLVEWDRHRENKVKHEEKYCMQGVDLTVDLALRFNLDSQ